MYILNKILLFVLFNSLVFANQKNIIDVFEDYNKSFAAKDYRNIVKHFDLPASFNLQEKTISASSKFKLKLIYRKIRGDLPEYYSHSVWDELEIEILDNKIAIVNAKFSRYKKDGTIFYTGSGKYSLRNTIEGWKFFSILPYDKTEKID